MTTNNKGRDRGDGATPTTSDTCNSKCYHQMVGVRGEALRRMWEWKGVAQLLAVRIPITDTDAIALHGMGHWFDPVLGDEVLAMCIGDALDSSPEAPLGELVEFLRKEVSR